ncbi:hypothetical protein BDR07DRAFT_802405 [Suillus spraguei]|nr:hypothetical protein BDR07DRAFT_802405 [Suillus spraguei]
MDVDIDPDYDVPDFVRAWHPSVRRPIIPPDPTIYHEAIHPRAIFELCETPSGDYIFVVPYSCTHCRSSKQTCSRLLPCDRCTKIDRPCDASQPGYQKLPPPKVTKRRKHALTPVSESPSTSRISQTPPAPPSKMIVASKSSQPIITSSNPRSPKKLKSTHPSSPTTPPKTSKCKGNKNKVDGDPLQNVPLKQPVNLETRSDAIVSTAPVWTFVRPPKTKFAIDSCAAVPTVDTLPCTPCMPRVWANSRAEIVSIFPELTKSLTGIVWRQFEMPALFLEHPHPEHSWRDENTLEVVL